MSMVITVNSAKLGRPIRVCTSLEAARECWRLFPDDRGSIYFAEEVEIMQGIDDESLQAVQIVKDVFLGARVDKYGLLQGNSFDNK